MVGKRLLITIIVLLILFRFGVDAASLGVSPAIYEIDFVPGLEKSFIFNFAGDNPDLEYVVNVTGDLAEYVNLDKYEYKGQTGEVTAFLKLPQNIDVPGTHRIFIGALSKSDNPRGGGTSIGLTTRVNGVIKVLVPYPGQYADIDFKINDANAGEKVEYKLIIYSRGKELIITQSRIEVYDSANERVRVFDVGSDVIPSTENVEINSNLDLSDLSAGTYKAVAIVSYSGEEKRAEGVFRLGELFVNIVNYTTEFDRYKINPIYIDIVSGWNDPIKVVFASGRVKSYSDISFQTPSIELAPWKEGRLIGYFDTSAIEEDEFQMDLVLHYEDKTMEKTIDLRLRKKKFNYLLWGGVALGILIVISFVVWMIVKLKRLKMKNGKSRKK